MKVTLSEQEVLTMRLVLTDWEALHCDIAKNSALEKKIHREGVALMETLRPLFDTCRPIEARQGKQQKQYELRLIDAPDE